MTAKDPADALEPKNCALMFFNRVNVLGLLIYLFSSFLAIQVNGADKLNAEEAKYDNSDNNNNKMEVLKAVGIGRHGTLCVDRHRKSIVDRFMLDIAPAAQLSSRISFFSLLFYFSLFPCLFSSPPLSLSLSLSLIFLLIFPLTGDELEMIFLARAGCNYEAVVGRFGWLIRVT